MSTSFLRIPMAKGPAAPPLMRKSPLAEQTLPIGVMTAAVPQAKASFSLPLAASARHWSMRVELLAHARAGIAGQRDHRIAGDARQDRAERRRQQRAVVEHEEDVHAAEFLDLAALDRVEEHDLVAAMLDRLGLRAQAGGVIAAAFDGAGAAGRGARVVLRHPDRDGAGAALEIGADRRGDDGEDVFRATA